MTTNVTLHAGHDVAYFTRGQDAGGCAGAMSYYTGTGEPPGQWAGTAARKSLGLTGQVDAGVLERLFMKAIGPDGEILAAKRQRKDTGEREEAAVAAHRVAHPYASAVEIAEVRTAERVKDPHTVPCFDLTISAVKSVSVLHASYRTGARQARDRGDEEEAAAARLSSSTSLPGPYSMTSRYARNCASGSTRSPASTCQHQRSNSGPHSPLSLRRSRCARDLHRHARLVPSPVRGLRLAALSGQSYSTHSQAVPWIWPYS